MRSSDHNQDGDDLFLIDLPNLPEKNHFDIDDSFWETLLNESNNEKAVNTISPQDLLQSRSPLLQHSLLKTPPPETIFFYLKKNINPLIVAKNPITFKKIFELLEKPKRLNDRKKKIERLADYFLHGASLYLSETTRYLAFFFAQRGYILDLILDCKNLQEFRVKNPHLTEQNLEEKLPAQHFIKVPFDLAMDYFQAYTNSPTSLAWMLGFHAPHSLDEALSKTYDSSITTFFLHKASPIEIGHFKAICKDKANAITAPRYT
jgi:hypothetical protein